MLYSVDCPPITGYTDEEIVGDSIYDHLLLNPDRERLARRTGPPEPETITFLARDGLHLDLAFTAEPVINRTTALPLAFRVTATVSHPRALSRHQDV